MIWFNLIWSKFTHFSEDIESFLALGISSIILNFYWIESVYYVGTLVLGFDDVEGIDGDGDGDDKFDEKMLHI